MTKHRPLVLVGTLLRRSRQVSVGSYLQALTSEGELGIKQPMHNLTASLGENMGCVLRAEEGFLERGPKTLSPNPHKGAEVGQEKTK